MNIRPMIMADIDAIAELEKLVFTLPWSRDSFRREVEENVAAEAVEENTVSGAAGTSPSEPSTAAPLLLPPSDPGVTRFTTRRTWRHIRTAVHLRSICVANAVPRDVDVTYGPS